MQQEPVGGGTEKNMVSKGDLWKKEGKLGLSEE